MRRFICIALLLSLAAGCKNVTGPFANRRNPAKVDDPLLPIDEQQKRGRETLSLPEDSRTIAPNAGVNRYGPTY